MKNGRVDILTFTQTLTTPYTVNTFVVCVHCTNHHRILLCVAKTLLRKSNEYFFFGIFDALVLLDIAAVPIGKEKVSNRQRGAH